MTPTLIGLIGMVLALVLIALRVPIAVAMGLVSFFGFIILTSTRAAWGMITAIPFDFIGNWAFTAVPMFLMMGYVCGSTGMTRTLFRSMRIILSRLPGGLAVTSVGACALFAAASGSSVATASAMARIAVPEMLHHRYHPGLATGVIAASGTLGSLIPPSVLMILYAVYAEVSVGKQFMAGFIPGIISALIYMAMIVVRVRLNPSLAPPVEEKFSRHDIWSAIREVWPLPTLIILVLGGIFTGAFTPTEAGAIGATLATVFAFLRQTFSRAAFVKALVQTASSTTSIFIILVGTMFITKLLALSDLPTKMSELMLGVSTSPIWILFAVSVLYIVLGMFVETTGLLLLTLPLILPVVNGAEIDLIWFGIVLIKLLEISLITPPVGLNVYVIKGAVGSLVPLDEVFRGVLWFLVMDVLTLIIIIAFPILSLYLPSLM
jgi:tripartite ATP-independent transporter DctM subunit